MRKAALPWCAALWIVSSTSPARAQQPGALGRASYPHSAKGLTQQIRDALVDLRKGNDAGVDEQLAVFTLPDPGSWLPRVPGADLEPAFTEHYRAAAKEYEDFWKSLLRSLAVQEEPDIRAQEARAAPERKVFPFATRLETFEFDLRVRLGHTNKWIDTFAYVDGAFRFVGWGARPLWVAMKASSPEKPVERAQLVLAVPPVFPRNLRANGLKAVVRVEGTIAEDGTVQDIKVLEGPPDFIELALAAVRQWRYRPTLLRGEPTAVRTAIDVSFAAF